MIFVMQVHNRFKKKEKTLQEESKKMKKKDFIAKKDEINNEIKQILKQLKLLNYAK